MYRVCPFVPLSWGLSLWDQPMIGKLLFFCFPFCIFYLVFVRNIADLLASLKHHANCQSLPRLLLGVFRGAIAGGRSAHLIHSGILMRLWHFCPAMGLRSGDWEIRICISSRHCDPTSFGRHRAHMTIDRYSLERRDNRLPSRVVSSTNNCREADDGDAQPHANRLLASVPRGN